MLKKRHIFAVAIVLLVFSGCSKNGAAVPEESPEEVVKKFYAYIKEGGPTTLGEAYRLISTKHYKMDEDIFKSRVSKYPDDLEVKVLGSEIKGDIAVVTIEYRTASSFGGYVTIETRVNLELDRKENRWKIDFTGETHEEDPSMYSS